jgi:hypothetical protein
MCAHNVMLKAGVLKRYARAEEETAAGKAEKRGRRMERLSGLSLARMCSGKAFRPLSRSLSLSLSAPLSNTGTHRSRFVIIRVKTAVCI